MTPAKWLVAATLVVAFFAGAAALLVRLTTSEPLARLPTPVAPALPAATADEPGPPAQPVARPVEAERAPKAPTPVESTPAAPLDAEHQDPEGSAAARDASERRQILRLERLQEQNVHDREAAGR
jgi:hypothetical protein